MRKFIGFGVSILILLGSCKVYAGKVFLSNGDVIEGELIEINPVKLGVIFATGDTMIVDRAVVDSTKWEPFKGKILQEQVPLLPQRIESIDSEIHFIRGQIGEAGTSLEKFSNNYFILTSLSILGGTIIGIGIFQDPPNADLILGGSITMVGSAILQIFNVLNVKNAGEKLRSVETNSYMPRENSETSSQTSKMKQEKEVLEKRPGDITNWLLAGAFIARVIILIAK